jgi:hypothetical protein
MSLWTIHAYHLAGCFCPIQEWYRAQGIRAHGIEVQAQFDAALGILKAEVDWTDTKLFKVLTKKHRGLGEIRFRLEGPPVRRFRPVGIWPPLIAYEFILLVGCEKVGGRYIPEDALTRALEYRRRFIDDGEGNIHEYV